MKHLHLIILVLSCTFFASAAKLFLKHGSTNGLVFVLIGLLLYGCGFLLYFHGLKHHEVTTIVPMLATSYLWVLIFAALLFGEPITIAKAIGTLSIVAGVAFIGSGGTQ